MTCQFAHDDGAYVLGALDPAERRVFEDHLPHCANCRSAVQSLAGLPGLLAHVPPALVENLGRVGIGGGESTTSTGTVVAIAPAPTPAPDTLLPRLMWAAKVERRKARRRTGLIGGGIAAAGVAIVFGGALLAANIGPEDGQQGNPPAAAEDSGTKRITGLNKTMEPQIDNLAVTASVELTETTAGTTLEMLCDWTKVTPESFPQEQKSYKMVVTDKDGQDKEVATFKVGPGDKVKIPATTQTPISDLDTVEVRQLDGTVLLSADL